MLTVISVCLFQALMALFVMYSKDGWVNIMYDGLDAVGVDQQVFLMETYLIYGDSSVTNYNFLGT